MTLRFITFICWLIVITSALGQVPEPPTPAAPAAAPPAAEPPVTEPPPVAEDALAQPMPAPEEPAVFWPERGRGRGRNRGGDSENAVLVGNDLVIAANETVNCAVVLFGSARVEGTVREDLVVLFGSATINGRVGGNVVTVFGSVKLGPEGVVEENLVAAGGSLQRRPGSTIGGQKVIIQVGDFNTNFSWAGDWIRHGFLLGRPLPPNVSWIWVPALICLAGYCLLALLFPRAVTASVRPLYLRPIKAFFVGILLLVLVVPALLLLIVSAVGILVVPFFICAFIAAYLFGKIAVYRYAGEQIIGESAGRAAALVALLLGISVFYLLYMVPFLGFVAWAITVPLGLGAAFMAVFAGRKTGITPSVPAAASIGPTPPTPPSPPTPMPSFTSPVPPPATAMTSSFSDAGPTATVPPMSASAGSFAQAAGAPEPVGAPRSIPPVYDGASPRLDASQLPRAGFWRRLLATLLDLVVIGMLALLTRSVPFFLLAWISYHVVMWAWRGTTLGGTILRLKVVRIDGRPMDLAVAIVRGLAGVLSAIVLFLGYIWAGWDRQKQSWHDKVAGTTIVRMPAGFSLI